MPASLRRPLLRLQAAAAGPVHQQRHQRRLQHHLPRELLPLLQVHSVPPPLTLGLGMPWGADVRRLLLPAGAQHGGQ